MKKKQGPSTNPSPSSQHSKVGRALYHERVLKLNVGLAGRRGGGAEEISTHRGDPPRLSMIPKQIHSYFISLSCAWGHCPAASS